MSATMATTDTIRMTARRMDITGRNILWAERLSGRGGADMDDLADSADANFSGGVDLVAGDLADRDLAPGAVAGLVEAGSAEVFAATALGASVAVDFVGIAFAVEAVGFMAEAGFTAEEDSMVAVGTVAGTGKVSGEMLTDT